MLRYNPTLSAAVRLLLPLCLLGFAFDGCWNGPHAVAADVQIMAAMDRDPQRELPARQRYFAPQLKSLWVAALGQPDTELQLQAAQTIARAHQLGMSGLEDAIEPLMMRLGQTNLHPLVRVACASALVALDARVAAPQLFDHWQTAENDLAAVVEPALARWKYEPIRKVWRNRLQDSQSRGSRLRYAMTGLAIFEDKGCVARLLEMVQEPLEMTVRLRAAEALAELRHEGLETTARRLMAAADVPPRLERLLAVTLLKHHRGGVAQELLLEMTGPREEPVVAARALSRLFDLDPDAAARIARETISSPDARLRLMSIPMLETLADETAVHLLTEVLDDRHPQIRLASRQGLLRLTQAEKHLDAVVRERTVEMLGTDRWRGQEQAIVLLVTLQHRQSAGRLVQLLDAPFPAVFRAAAWGLRELSVPGAFPAMLRKAEREVAAGLVTDMDREIDVQVSYLMEAFGLAGYRQAEPLMRKCIPKKFTMGSEVRAAAIWALGHLYAGQTPRELSAMLLDRLNDRGSNAMMDLPAEEVADESRPEVTGLSGPGMESMYAEVERVRCMCAVSLGRMGMKTMVEDIRKHYSGTTGSALDFACAWSLQQLTGEPLPPPEKVQRALSNWFLEPLEP